MIYKIYWIEDEPESISEEIELIKSKLKGDVHIDIFENIGDYLSRELKNDTSDLVIFDLKIDKEKDKFIILNLFEKSQISKPCLFYTRYNDEQPLLDLEKKNNQYLLGVLKKVRDKDKLIKLILQLQFYQPISFLHLSDLHFDYLNTKEQENRLNAFSTKLNELNVDFVAITGDLSNKDPYNDLNNFQPILKKILKDKFGDSYIYKTFIIPGNHELGWSDFKNKKLSNNPFFDYMNFYLSFFDDNDDILKTLNYLGKKDILRTKIKNENTSWCRSFKNLNIIGLNSSIDDANLQGKGFFTEKHENYIRENWILKVKSANEIRILLLHHNVFQPITFSHQEDNTQITNTGVLIKYLLESDCDIVLSGHTHFPSIINFNGASFLGTKTKFKEFKGFYNLSSGTFGGYGAQKVTHNYFEQINIIPHKTYSDKIEWKVFIIPYQYEPSEKIWEKTEKALSFKLRGKNRS